MGPISSLTKAFLHVTLLIGARFNYFASDVLDVRASLEEHIRPIFPDLGPKLGTVAGLGQAPLPARVPVAIVRVHPLHSGAHHRQVAQPRRDLPLGRHVHQGRQVHQGHGGEHGHGHAQTEGAADHPLGPLHRLPHFGRN